MCVSALLLLVVVMDVALPEPHGLAVRRVHGVHAPLHLDGDGYRRTISGKNTFTQLSGRRSRDFGHNFGLGFGRKFGRNRNSPLLHIIAKGRHRLTPQNAEKTAFVHSKFSCCQL